MGLFDKLFNNKAKKAAASANAYFKTLTAYMPSFTTWQGSIYESELIRSAIDARARHISKLHIVMEGSAHPALRTRLNVQPNSWQTWGQFLYRTSTILDMNNTCVIVPVIDEYGDPTGYYPVLPGSCELVEYDGVTYMRYRFQSGDTAALPLSQCAVLTKFQYDSDFFGATNDALLPTLDMIKLQRKGIEEAVKNGASFRFAAQMGNFAQADDLRKEAEKFNKTNLQGEGGGVLLFPNTYTNIQQLKSTPYTVDESQLNMIKTNVYNYFGVNEAVMQNTAKGDDLDAFYNGAIEPFQVQLSETLTMAMFTNREIAQGNKIVANANRLQYMTTTEKVSLSQQLGDRGALSINEIRELFNYPPLDDKAGDAHPIRGEYYDLLAGKDNGGTDDGSGITEKEN